MNHTQYQEVRSLLEEDCTVWGRYSNEYGTCAIGKLAQAVGYPPLDESEQMVGIGDLVDLMDTLRVRFGLEEYALDALQAANDAVIGLVGARDSQEVIEKRRQHVLGTLDYIFFEKGSL